MTDKTIAICATVRRMMELEEQKRETLSKLLVTIAAKDQSDANDGSLGTMSEWENLREDVLVLAGLKKDTRYGYFNRSSRKLKDRLERLERVRDS